MSHAATLVANIKKAIRDNTPVSVGGGVFSPDELREALKEIEPALFGQLMVVSSSADLSCDSIEVIDDNDLQAAHQRFEQRVAEGAGMVSIARSIKSTDH